MATIRIATLLLAAALAVSATQASASDDAVTVVVPAATEMSTVEAGSPAAKALEEALPGVDAIARLKQIYRCRAHGLQEAAAYCKILIGSIVVTAEVRS